MNTHGHVCTNRNMYTHMHTQNRERKKIEKIIQASLPPSTALPDSTLTITPRKRDSYSHSQTGKLRLRDIRSIAQSPRKYMAELGVITVC